MGPVWFMGVAAVNLHSVPLAQLAWSPGDRTDLSVVQVYAVLAGASFFIVLCTGLLAFWLHRRARRARRLERTPVPRPPRSGHGAGRRAGR
jgi:predicted lysophospholipase L1 biosynthesis ABC-type transport system permease subunit